jgi:hypothetical protein
MCQCGSHRYQTGLGSADIIPGIERGALDPTIVSRLRCMNATLSGFRNPNSEIALAAQPATQPAREILSE